ncbi:MAG: glycosyltransferase family 39 protein, partial [Planctomycetes bacterium]|nr:glycosyltransferase family 39 protein [Planctomycetota bacterium]
MDLLTNSRDNLIAGSAAGAGADPVAVFRTPGIANVVPHRKPARAEARGSVPSNGKWSSLSASPPSPWHGRAVVLIVIIAGTLRFAALDQYPLPIHQDELSDTYDGYSVASTGADRSGDRWPIIVRGMGPGDYHPGLYVYLAAITTGLAGFSVWSGRLPAAIAGMLTVLLVYAVARRTLGRRGALLALAFVAFSPVHILYSRQAHTGGCLPPLFIILVVYLLLRLFNGSNEKRTGPATWWWAIAAGLVVGLFTSAYGAARLSALLLAMLGAGLIVVQFGLRQRDWRRMAITLGLFASAVTVGALPQLYAMVAQPEEYFARASNVLLPF